MCLEFRTQIKGTKFFDSKLKLTWEKTSVSYGTIHCCVHQILLEFSIASKESKQRKLTLTQIVDRGNIMKASMECDIKTELVNK